MAGLQDLVKAPADVSLPVLWRTLTPAERENALLQCLNEDKASRPQWVQLAMTLPRFRAFRPKVVAALPDSDLVAAIASSKQLSPDVIQTALIGLHLPARAAMLGAFLDALGIPHKDGLITDSATVALPREKGRLEAAVTQLLKDFPKRDVTVYLLTLLAMDPETWKPLAELLPGLAPELAE